MLVEYIVGRLMKDASSRVEYTTTESCLSDAQTDTDSDKLWVAVEPGELCVPEILVRSRTSSLIPSRYCHRR